MSTSQHTSKHGGRVLAPGSFPCPEGQQHQQDRHRTAQHSRPGNKEGGLLHQGAGGFPCPESQQHQQNRNQQLHHHSQPVPLGTDGTLHKQRPELAAVQHSALGLAQATLLLGGGVGQLGGGDPPCRPIADGGDVDGVILQKKMGLRTTL